MPATPPHLTDVPAPATRARRTRDMAARVWRSRVSRLASIWIMVAVVEYLAWRFFLRSTFYRDFFTPIAVAVLILAIAASWRTLGRRESDRRAGDRRRADRRDGSGA